MTVDSIDVDATVRRVRELLEQEKNISPALRAVLDVLLVLVVAMQNRLTLNSKNSSTPPSKDSKKPPSNKKNETQTATNLGGKRVMLEKLLSRSLILMRFMS